MLKRRLIPVLYLMDGQMMRSEGFSVHQAIGHPVIHVERLVQWDVDELIVLDISRHAPSYDFGRSDTRRGSAADLLEFVGMIAAECNIPLAFGGHVRSFDDIRAIIQNGADKITLNSALVETPDLVDRAARGFGSQAVVASLDYRHTVAGPRVFTHCGTRDTGEDPIAWARRVADAGAGEILLTAIDRDGAARGYDLETIDQVAQAVEIPVIACGGAGHMSHFAKVFADTAASAVAAGNIFHFTENAYPRAKAYLRRQRQDVR